MANNQNLKPFKPGVSGNPKGKPRGTKNWSTILKKIMQSNMNLREHPLTKKPGVKMTVKEMLIYSMVKEALKGNVRAAQFLADREEGKVTQSIKAVSETNGPIILRWIGEGEDYPPIDSHTEQC